MKPEYVLPNETVTFESRGTNIQGKLSSRMGKFVLTNERLVFIETPFWLGFMFGIIGMMLAARRKGKPKFEIKLSNIASVERTKYVLNKNVINVKTKDGQDYKLAIDKNIEQWIEEIKKHISE